MAAIEGLRALPMSMDVVRRAGDHGFLFQYLHDPYVRYASFDGKTTYQYNTDLIPDRYINKFRSVLDYVSDGSSVYMLTDKGNYATNPNPETVTNTARAFISRYDIKGAYRSTVELEGKYDYCVRLAFAGGSSELLIVSCVATEKNKTPFTDPVRGYDPTPFVGLFQTNGQFLRRLELPNDLESVPTVDSSKHDGGYELAKVKAIHSLDAKSPSDLEYIITQSCLDNDSQNTIITRFSPFWGTGHADQTPVVYVLDRNLTVRRIELPKSQTRMGGISDIRLMRGRIVTLYRETNDASERWRFILRVYDLKGKLVSEYGYDPYDFGVALLDWNPHRALFATQTGDPKDPRLGVIEGME